MDEDDDEYGCYYCRNDGRLNSSNCCPKCDAWYPPDDAGGLSTPPAKEQQHD